MDINLLIIIIIFSLINLNAFLIMLLDKIKSENNKSERISEGLLFFIASAFGSLGIYAGMFLFRHKTRKWYFLIGIPLIFIENVAVFYILYLWRVPELLFIR